MSADNPTYEKLRTLITQPLALHAAEQLWDASTLFDLTTDILDTLWPEIEKYQKFAEAVVALGPDGIQGMIEYLGGGELIPFDPENYFSEVDNLVANRARSDELCDNCRGKQPHESCGNHPDTCQCCYETIVDL